MSALWLWIFGYELKGGLELAFKLYARIGSVELIRLTLVPHGIAVLEQGVLLLGEFMEMMRLHQIQRPAFPTPNEASHSLFAVIPTVQKTSDTAVGIFRHRIVFFYTFKSFFFTAIHGFWITPSHPKDRQA